MQNEIWKSVKGYEGLYEVSNLGNVKSIDRFIERSNQWGKYIQKYKGKILKNVLHPNGYFRVDIQGKLFSVHRLVAENFILNKDISKEVNHKDGNKLNNHVDNLEWVTHSENIRHADRTGLRNMPKGENHASYGRISSKSKKVIDTGTGKIYSGAKEASIEIGMKYINLNNRLRGVIKNDTPLKYM